MDQWSESQCSKSYIIQACVSSGLLKREWFLTRNFQNQQSLRVLFIICHDGARRQTWVGSRFNLFSNQPSRSVFANGFHGTICDVYDAQMFWSKRLILAPTNSLLYPIEGRICNTEQLFVCWVTKTAWEVRYNKCIVYWVVTFPYLLQRALSTFQQVGEPENL